MSTPLIVANTLSIQAPAALVWDALVNPEQTKKYMFGCAALSDWKPGSPLLWEGTQEGKPMVFVKGTVLEFRPHEYLAYTVIDPNNPSLEDIPENYLTVTCTLHEEGGQTLLSVTQGDYATVGDGASRYKHTVEGGGWEPILVQIKKLLEAS